MIRGIRRTRNRSPRKDAGSPVGWIIFAVVSLVFGVMLWDRGVNERAVSAELDRRGVPAAATVVAVKHKTVGGTVSSPSLDWTVVTVAFTDARGVARRASREGRDSTKVGDRFQILYDPQQPAHVRWHKDVDETYMDLGFGVAALALAVALTISAAVALRRQRQAGRSTDLPE
jgi:hypothetical protein